MQNLECHIAVVLAILCEVYGGHAAAPELTLDVVLFGQSFFEAFEHPFDTLARGIPNLRDGQGAREGAGLSPLEEN